MSLLKRVEREYESIKYLVHDIQQLLNYRGEAKILGSTARAIVMEGTKV
jgi:hypothetical protein